MVIAAALLSMGALLLFPSFDSWHRERRLDMAAAQASAVIRLVQTEAKSGDVTYGAGNRIYKRILFTMPAGSGRVRYYSSRGGIYIIGPKGWLPAGVVMSPFPVEIEFRQNGFPAGGEYSFRLIDEKGRLARQIIVAAYTGRVRVEKRDL